MKSIVMLTNHVPSLLNQGSIFQQNRSLEKVGVYKLSGSGGNDVSFDNKNALQNSLMLLQQLLHQSHFFVVWQQPGDVSKSMLYNPHLLYRGLQPSF